MCVDIPVSGQVADDLGIGEVAVEIHDHAGICAHGHQKGLDFAQGGECNALNQSVWVSVKKQKVKLRAMELMRI